MWRKLRKFFLVTASVVLYLALTVTFLLKFFENDIKNYAVDQIEDYLNTSVYINDIEFSIWEKFPRASLNFKNMLIRDAYPNEIKRDTFFSSKNLYLEFDIYDILAKKYHIKEITCDGARLNIRINKEGEGNYNIVKSKNDSTEATKFELALQKVSFDDLAFNYFNQQHDQHYSVDASNLNLVGNFTSDSFELQSNTALYIRKMRNKAISLINKKSATVDLILKVNTNTQTYRFEKGLLNLEKMPFEINGWFQGKKMNFTAKGQQITLDKLMHTVNKSISGQINQYRSQGMLDFNLKMTNEDTAYFEPNILADFSINNGSITEPIHNITLKEINLKGRYSNRDKPGKEFLELKNLSAKTLDGDVKGSLRIRNFAQPLLTSNLTGHANLKTLHQFFNFKGIETITGNVDLYSRMSISINDPKYAPERFKIKQNKGKLDLKEIAIKPTGNSHFYEHINGTILLQGNDAVAKNVDLKIKKSDVKINGSIKNLVQFLEDKGKLNIVASVESKLLKLEDLLLPPTPTRSTTQKILPANINLNLDLDLDQLFIGKQEFKNIASKIKLLDRKLNVSKIYVEHSEGKLTGNLSFNNQGAQSYFDANLRLKRINIQQLFKNWDNFDQKIITEQNIKGIANVTTKINAVLDAQNEIIKDRLIAETSFKIYKGELIRVPMMQTIVNSMKSNKMVKLVLKNHIDDFAQKLNHLKFDTLSNSIYVKNQVVTMPKMKIASSAIDLNVSATHTFANKIDYHFDFLFNQIKGKEQYTEFGKVANDGTGLRIFLHMFGTVDNPQFGWDKAGKKQAKKEQLEEEKRTIKSMLKSEFGLFKNDSTVNNYKKTPKQEEEVLFYDGEFEQQEEPNLIKPEKPKKKKNKKKTNAFFQKLKNQQEEDRKNTESTFEIGE